MSPEEDDIFEQVFNERDLEAMNEEAMKIIDETNRERAAAARKKQRESDDD